MANDVTSPRLWVLDTVGQIVAPGTEVKVRSVFFFPVNVADDLVLKEYDPDGATLRNAIILKAGPVVQLPIELPFGPDGRRFNGLYLSTIDSGSTVYLYIGKD